MTPEQLLLAGTADWSPERQQALLRVRAFYQQSGDLFSKAELGRMRFIRWLYRTGQLES